MKPRNWISATGTMPPSARPSEAPTIEASASGVSKTRSGPNRSWSPRVTRKTPPSVPTSSPSTMTRSSRSISSQSASWIALRIDSSAGRVSVAWASGTRSAAGLDAAKLDGGGRFDHLLEASHVAKQSFAALSIFLKGDVEEHLVNAGVLHLADILGDLLPCAAG